MTVAVENMPNETVALKADFKIEKGIVRIIDIGDGLGADTAGFEDTPLRAKLVSDMHEATGAPLATIFGELPYDAMQSESMHVPLVLRQSSVDADDLSSSRERFLPYSEIRRLQSFISYAWGKKLDQTIVTPIGLMAMEMHKILWYFLLQKHMAPEYQSNILYWSNDTHPSDIDLNAINIQHDVFIKIADRSEGGASEVYYAKDTTSLFDILNQLHTIYNTSPKQYKQHIFVIEPAYLTLKQHQGRDYNVTGRAFFTVIYDKTTQTLNVKIAAAKWMFPTTAIQQEDMTQEQMLSNIKHSIKMQQLDHAELSLLSSSILGAYGRVFKASFEHEDLMAYCVDHPKMNLFLSCLRPNASYKRFLETFKCGQDNYEDREKLLMIQIHSLIARDSIQNFNHILRCDSSSISFFATLKTPDDIMKEICLFSLFEKYISYAKTCSASFKRLFTFIDPLIHQEQSIKSRLDRHISQYLSLKTNADTHYDTQDMNRALRQAAFMGDITVIKLLIYTHRADVNACSPTGKTALDYAIMSGNVTNKERCLLLLKQAGAQVRPLSQAVQVASSRF